MNNLHDNIRSVSEIYEITVNDVLAGRGIIECMNLMSTCYLHVLTFADSVE